MGTNKNTPLGELDGDVGAGELVAAARAAAAIREKIAEINDANAGKVAVAQHIGGGLDEELLLSRIDLPHAQTKPHHVGVRELLPCLGTLMGVGEEGPQHKLDALDVDRHVEKGPAKTRKAAAGSR